MTAAWRQFPRTPSRQVYNPHTVTIDKILNALKTPSDEAWRRLVNWLDAQPSGGLECLPRLQQALSRWPDSLQRTAPKQWLDPAREPLLALCWAPGGLLVEAYGGGGGLPAYSITELVAPDRLEDAVLDYLPEVFEHTGHYGASITATPFRHGRVCGELVELMGHVEATYAPMQASFRLDTIPSQVEARLREHRELCFQSSNNDSPDLLVPLDIRWRPVSLCWPSTEGAPDWHVFEGLSVHAGKQVLYRDSSSGAHARPTREYWPPEPTSDNEGVAVLLPQAAAALDELERTREVSISTMLAAKSVGELVHTLMTLVARFGVWKGSSKRLESAVEQALFQLSMLPDPSRRARRISEVLDEYGKLSGPALETVAGLLCIHEHDHTALLAELEQLLARELLVMRKGGRLDALVPLCAWALSAHPSLAQARAALAEAIVDHPFVDDLFCADEALLVGTFS